MSSPWKIQRDEVEIPISLDEIMDEEFARRIHADEISKCMNSDQGESLSQLTVETSIPREIVKKIEENEEIIKISRVPVEILEALKDEPDYQKLVEIDSDAKIAQMLQAQFDREHDTYLKRCEKVNNKNSKVQISFEKYRIVPNGIIDESDDESKLPVPEDNLKDWDRFETNEKEYSKLNKKKGYLVNEEGEMKTKHDADINGRRNACKVMSFPPEFETGDAGAFDMRLENKVFNQLKQSTKKKKFDRKEAAETAVMSLDEATRLILYKLINNRVLETVDGIISTGKEAVILHAETDPNNESDPSKSKEVAIKIFSTTLNEFKQRDRYIKGRLFELFNYQGFGLPTVLIMLFSI